MNSTLHTRDMQVVGRGNRRCSGTQSHASPCYEVILLRITNTYSVHKKKKSQGGGSSNKHCIFDFNTLLCVIHPFLELSPPPFSFCFNPIFCNISPLLVPTSILHFHLLPSFTPYSLLAYSITSSTLPFITSFTLSPSFLSVPYRLLYFIIIFFLPHIQETSLRAVT